MKKTSRISLIAVDIALFSIVDDSLQVLLVQRAYESEDQPWALPSGVLNPMIDVSLEVAARRVLRNNVTVEISHLEQVHAYSDSGLDPSEWSVSLLYLALLPSDQITSLSKTKDEKLDWFDASNPGKQLALDQREKLDGALQVLRNKIQVTAPALPLHLMPDRFTLTELQKTCQCILGRDINKAAFRRRLKDSSDLVEVQGEMQRGAHAPAQLYKARDGFTFNVHML